MAYHLARVLGLTQIPSQAVLPALRRIDSPWTNFTDRLNVQSLLRDVELVFLDLDWANCLPENNRLRAAARDSSISGSSRPSARDSSINGSSEHDSSQLPVMSTRRVHARGNTSYVENIIKT